MKHALLTMAAMLTATVAWAGDVNVHLNFQPDRYVREVCGDEQPWGCIYWTTATDNPADHDCHIRMSIVLVDLPIERRHIEDDLRAQCEAGP